MHRAVLAALLAFAGCPADPVQGPAPVEAPAAVEVAPSAEPRAALPPDRLVVALDIPAGSSFGEVVAPWGLPAHAVREAARAHHDLALIDVRRELGLVFEDGHAGPVGLRYAITDDTTLVVQATDANDWQAWIEAVAWQSATETRVLDIDASLWQAGVDAGLRPADLYRLARIFEYEVDFNTEIRQGARLGIVAEVLRADGHDDRLGDIHAVRFVNDGRLYDAVRHVGADGIERFYHPDGTSTERAFLRSPLEFSRVTSGFNPKRFHPILKVRRPHNGTDFGAPTGTPVRAVASGVVTYAGRNAGHGNFVKIRHDGVYETSYSHLSRIAVRQGQRVAMGQRIGAVGSTGMSTAPHLHYQMWRNGKFVDALREKLPTSTPVPKAERGGFDAAVTRWLPALPFPVPEGLASAGG